MDDLISRQAAITAAVEAADEWDGGYNYERQLIIEEALARIPSAERKKGKWIGEPKDGIEAMFFKPKCSVCGFESAEVKNYCPNCGSFNGGVE